MCGGIGGVRVKGVGSDGGGRVMCVGERGGRWWEGCKGRRVGVCEHV